MMLTGLEAEKEQEAEEYGTLDRRFKMGLNKVRNRVLDIGWDVGLNHDTAHEDGHEAETKQEALHETGLEWKRGAGRKCREQTLDGLGG